MKEVREEAQKDSKAKIDNLLLENNRLRELIAVADRERTLNEQ